MDFKDFRKLLFINSQYCTSYNSNGNTILAGIMRDIGYKYSVILPQEKIVDINKMYRKFTTLINSLIAVEIVLYIYLVIFPYFVQLMKLPYYLVVLILSFIPLLALYFTYLGVNLLYEDYLKRYVGSFKKVKFEPSLDKIDDKSFYQYKKTPRKSVFVLALMVILFVLYAFTPPVVESLLLNEKYKAALNVSNAYITFVPIDPQVYAQRAYAKFKLKKYKSSVNDFEKANEYSLSNTFDYHIAGVKTYYSDKNSMIKEFDRLISDAKDEDTKNYLLSQKATYLVKMHDYNDAIQIYNKLIAIYEKERDVSFNYNAAYYKRAFAKSKVGDYAGAKADLAISEAICETCKFDLETTMVRMP